MDAQPDDQAADVMGRIAAGTQMLGLGGGIYEIVNFVFAVI